MRSKIILALAAGFLARIASAGSTCNQAAGKQIKGLAVSSPNVTTGPSLGSNFDIQWEPTSGYSTVSILLLKGPSTNVVPYSCIANSVTNNGHYSWFVPSSGIDAQSTGYGIQIIADGSGDFQYSSQFGISSGSSGSVIAVTSTTRVSGEKVTQTIYHTSSSSSSQHEPTSHYTSHKISHTHHSNHSTAYPTAASASASGNITESVKPTKSPSLPASLPNVGGSGHEITGSPSEAATSTSAPTTTASKAAGAKVDAVVGGGFGVVAGLGAVAALVL